jgi:hypothetical protein
MKFFWNEQWVEMEMAEDGKLHRRKYAVSNYGRVVSYTDRMDEGKLLKFGFVGGYPALSLGQKVKYSRCVHKLVAHYFLPAPAPGQEYVIHLDFEKTNNFVDNIRWATHEEMVQHQNNNPRVQYARRHPAFRTKGTKLTDKQVKRLKKAIDDPNRKRTYKQIAKKYGISEMQLYRIKSGANWKHVNVSA